MLPHFIGASPGSTSLRRILRRVCHALATALGIPAALPEDLYQLIERFQTLLTQAAATHHVILLLDALNQFDPAEGPHGMYWLPREFPPTVRLILSTLTLGSKEESAEPRPEVQALQARGAQVREVSLPPLDQTDARMITKEFLTRHGKRLSPEQYTALLAKTESGSPLYLRVALEELRTLGMYAEITDRLQALPGDVHALVRWIFTVRLSKDPGFRDADGQPIGAALVSRVASLLGASRYGLSQAELVELVDPGDPLGNVAALQRLLRPYLMRRGELLDFYHSQFRTAVEAEYLQEEGDRVAAHRTLVEYFQRYADPAGDGTWTGGTPRALRELPYHTLEGQQYDTSFFLARDERFLAAQGHAFPGEPRLPLETLQQAIRAAAAQDDAGKMAESSLRHAKRVAVLNQESPLDALRAGNLQRAWQLADFGDSEGCALWHLLLTWELKDTGNREAARQTLERLEQMHLLRLSNQGLAGELLSRIGDIGSFTGLCTRLLDDESLSTLCGSLAAEGMISVAFEIAQRIDSQWRHQVQALQAIATAQAREGDPEGARRTFTQAREMAQRIKSGPHQAQVLEAIATAQAQAGDREGARRTVAQALEIAQQIESGPGQPQLLSAIAAAQAQAGDVGESQGTFEEAIDAAQQIDNLEYRAEALCDTAAAQARAGHGSAAMRTADHLPANRNEYLPSIAEALAQFRDKATFKRFLIPCSNYLDSAYRMCGLLAQLYPEQVTAIAEAIRNETR